MAGACPAHPRRQANEACTKSAIREGRPSKHAAGLAKGLHHLRAANPTGPRSQNLEISPTNPRNRPHTLQPRLQHPQAFFLPPLISAPLPASKHPMHQGEPSKGADLETGSNQPGENLFHLLQEPTTTTTTVPLPKTQKEAPKTKTMVERAKTSFRSCSLARAS